VLTLATEQTLGMLEEVQLDGDGGRVLTLRRVQDRDADGIWSYSAELRLPEGQMTTNIWDMGTGLGPFIREIANAWRGFEGVREYGSLEGQLWLACTHDGLGTIRCEVTLRNPTEWALTATLALGAGAHVERLAGDVEAFVG
jgi:hypothetical protein